MIVSDVADELVARLKTIPGLRVYKGAPGSVSVPAAVVFVPGETTFTRTYSRGMDQMTWPILLLVGKVDDSQQVKSLGAYLDGSGAKSIVQVLESGTYTSFDAIHVDSATTDPETWGDASYAGALFTVNIYGKGRA
jgi:hypothetical protein